ncbi:UvrD-helicase domain-containing protein [Parvibacter caecicola]|uniref:DNA helicase n=1 Tax=Parvibacter caecicola TaxID=747645 RepID=A0A4T9T9T1_9ACTN|nr:UvrD-helicase domain-containing protein [Parvibacter caecicola]TJW12315.1 DNA helicase [Parvibacter caecicola]
MTLTLRTAPEVVLYKGAVGTGKTSALVAAAAEKVAAGAAPESLLVFASTPDAAAQLEKRLAAAGVGAVRVTTPRAFCLQVLAAPAAREATGRDPRLVSSFDQAFIMEDMKVSGLKIKRLREMLKFFYRGWTELSGEDPEWLVTAEEESVHGMLKGTLGFTRSILEPELAALTWGYLHGHEDALAAVSVDHVLVDDYQQLSRASQFVANMVARQSVTAAADPLACIEVYDSYPYGAGVDELEQAGAEVRALEDCHLCGASLHAAQVLADELEAGAVVLGNPDNLDASVSFGEFPCDTSHDEFSSIAQRVGQLSEAGVTAEDIFLLTFNKQWARQLKRYLTEQGIAVNSAFDGRLAAGDYRDYARCAPARVITALQLAADPENCLAWRCWIGFGDYLGNSAALSEIYAWAKDKGYNLLEVLQELAAMDAGAASLISAGAGRIVAAYRSGCAVVEQVDGLSGLELIRKLVAAVDATAPASVQETIIPEKVEEMVVSFCAPVPGAATAKVIAATVTDRLTDSRLEGNGGVMMGSGAHVVGSSPKALLVCGFDNGFIPERDYFDTTVVTLDKQEKMHEADTRFLYTVLGKATDQLQVSYFTSIDLVGAEKLKLKVDRIRLKNGMRMARLTASEFLPVILPTD